MKIARWLLAAFLLVIFGGSLLLTLSPDLTRWPVAPTQPAPEKGSVTLTYLGTSTILISDGHTHLLTDGYFSRVSIPRLLFTRIAPNAQRIEHALAQAGITSLDAQLVLHSHFDHAMDVAEVAKRTGAQLLGSSSTAMVGKGGGLPDSRITTIVPHQPYSFGQFTVHFVPASHVPLPAPVEAMTGKGDIGVPVTPPARVGAWEEGQSYAVVITHPAGSLLIQGSSGAVPGALTGYQADYALLASASLGKQSDRYQRTFMEETAIAVGAHTVIPVHWDDFFSELTPDVKPLPWGLDNMHNSFHALADRHDGDFWVLPPFQPFTLTPGAQSPSVSGQ